MAGLHGVQKRKARKKITPERVNEVTVLIRKGLSAQAACEKVGMSINSYYAHRPPKEKSENRTDALPYIQGSFKAESPEAKGPTPPRKTVRYGITIEPLGDDNEKMATIEITGTLPQIMGTLTRITGSTLPA